MKEVQGTKMVQEDVVVVAIMQLSDGLLSPVWTGRDRFFVFSFQETGTWSACGMIRFFAVGFVAPRVLRLY